MDSRLVCEGGKIFCSNEVGDALRKQGVVERGSNVVAVAVFEGIKDGIKMKVVVVNFPFG